jgi:hypothetical protein
VAGLAPLNSAGERKIAKVGFEPLATVWRSSRQLPSSRGEGIDRLEGALLTLTENMPNRPASAWSAVKFLRAALLSGASMAFLLAWAAPADATRSKAATSAKKTNPQNGFGEAAKNSVLQIVVSIGSQRATLFSDGVPIAQTSVSTGTPGHLTPMGVFSIIQKDRYHHSNLYGNAPMYYMQRITWSGVAMHEGFVTGRPASHGCIRLPHGFAASLWPTTKLGVRVIVARHDLAPAAFEHPLLFTPRPKPPDSNIDVPKPTPSELLVVAESTRDAKDAFASDANRGREWEVKPAGDAVDPARPPIPSPKAAAQPPKRNGQVAVFVSRKEGKVFVRQGFVPLFDMPVQIDEAERPLGTHVFTAMGPKSDGSGMRWNVMTIPTQASNTTTEKRRTHGKSKEPPPPVVAATPPSTAAQALDRIHLPQEAVDRISELLIPGSSLLVSDQAASGETGAGTEFIVLTR